MELEHYGIQPMWSLFVTCRVLLELYDLLKHKADFVESVTSVDKQMCQP